MHLFVLSSTGIFLTNAFLVGLTKQQIKKKRNMAALKAAETRRRNKAQHSEKKSSSRVGSADERSSVVDAGEDQ